MNHKKSGGHEKIVTSTLKKNVTVSSVPANSKPHAENVSHKSAVDLSTCASLLRSLVSSDSFSTSLSRHRSKFDSLCLDRIKTADSIKCRTINKINSTNFLPEVFDPRNNKFIPLESDSASSGKEDTLAEWFNKSFSGFISSKSGTKKEITTNQPTPTEIQNILSGGSNNNLLKVSIPVFRPFISSTFTDTAFERDLLILLVYPLLAEYARQSKVAFFQPSEMRWGIGNNLSDNHLTSETCISELLRCQTSQGLSYILILGDKYGSRIPRASIPKEDFEQFLKHINEPADLKVLTSWYSSNTNKNEYYLRPLRDEATRNAFWTGGEASRIHAILSAAALHVFPLPSDPRSSLYSISITHEEAYFGIDCIDKTLHSKSVAAIIRNLEGLADYDLHTNKTNQKELRNWVDLTTESSVNIPCQTSLWHEKEYMFESKDCDFNVASFTVPPAETGVLGLDIGSQIHRGYFKAFLRHITLLMINSIDQINEKGSMYAYCTKDVTFREAIAHNEFAMKKNETFIHTKFTEDCLKTILGLVGSSTAASKGPNPKSAVAKAGSVPDNGLYFTVVGSSGSGKTSLMANVFVTLREKFPSKNIIIRFLGTTSNSTDIIPMLQTLIDHILRLYPSINKAGYKSTTNDYTQLCKVFCTLLTTVNNMTTGKPLIILLDSLDQLSKANNSHKLAFLPLNMQSKHLKIILSVIPEEQYEVWPMLMSLFPPVGPPSVVIPAWTNKDGENVLNTILKKKKFSLTEQQRSLLLQKFSKCPNGIFMVLSTFIASKWKSSPDERWEPLADDVQGSIRKIFDKLVEEHGRALVVTFLSLITLSGGLSFDELLHMLSLNDTVLNEVFEWWVPPIRRLPPLLLTRILSVLEPFLVTRDNYGVPEIFWYHRHFWTTAFEYAARNNEESVKYFTQMVEYFDGRWHGQDKSYTAKNTKAALETNRFIDIVYGRTKEGQSNDHMNTFTADRLVPSQSWIYSNGLPNARKLWILPTVAVEARDWSVAKEALCSMGALTCAACSGMQEELKEKLRESISKAELREKELSRSCVGIALQKEKKDLADFLVHVRATYAYIKVSNIAIDDNDLVLQRALNMPRESPVRKMAVDCLDAISSMRTVTNYFGICKPLVIAQNLPVPTSILSKVTVSSSSIQGSHVWFGEEGSNIVLVALVSSDGKDVFVYDMIRVELAFTYPLPGALHAGMMSCRVKLMWSPSGRKIAVLVGNRIHLALLSKNRDFILFTTICSTLTLPSPLQCLMWADEDYIIVGNNEGALEGLQILTQRDGNTLSLDKPRLSPDASVLSQIATTSPHNLDPNGGGMFTVISPQGKYMAKATGLKITIISLRSPSAINNYDISLDEYKSVGGGSSIRSLSFNTLGELYTTMRGNVVAFALGNSTSTCIRKLCAPSQASQGLQDYSNWTDFGTCHCCPSNEYIAVAVSGGAFYILKCEGDKFVFLVKLSGHSQVPSLLQFNELNTYLLTKSDNEILLWDLREIFLKHSNDSQTAVQTVSTKVMASKVTDICWHPTGKYFMACGDSSVLAAYNAVSGVQFNVCDKQLCDTVFYDSKFDVFMFTFNYTPSSTLRQVYMYSLFHPTSSTKPLWLYGGQQSPMCITEMANTRQKNSISDVYLEEELLCRFNSIFNSKQESNSRRESKSILAFECLEQDLAAYYVLNNDIDSMSLEVKRLSTKAVMCTVQLPTIGNVNTFLGGMSPYGRLAVVSDLTLLAVAIGFRVVFYHVNWSPGYTSASAVLLPHKFDCASEVSMLKFGPLVQAEDPQAGGLNRVTYPPYPSKAPLLAIGGVAGDVTLVRVVMDVDDDTVLSACIPNA